VVRGKVGSLGIRSLVVLLACMVASAAFLLATNSESQGQARNDGPGERPPGRGPADGPGRGPGEKAVLVIHGGTTGLDRGDVSPNGEALRRQDLIDALEAGKEVLDNGGSSVDAVEAAVVVMEDDDRWNAGRGAVPNAEGEYELDASIMKGDDLDAGAVAIARGIKNPIKGARAVMEDSPHVMLGAGGADRFAEEQGLEMVPNQYFDEDSDLSALEAQDSTGTVGAVARDKDGNLAAATSTGGRRGKLPGRIGDSPVIGAGTYADNDTVAVSGTGVGELFIRGTAARDVSVLMEYTGMPVDRAAKKTLEKVVDIGGQSSNGIIALDKRGNFATVYTSNMYRGWVTEDGEIVTQIYRQPDQLVGSSESG
jgi:beta-aspartyl-peptidase (threonine type)